jgi:PRTRC genetic system protein B
MKDITHLFAESHLPLKALLFYQSTLDESFYIESHDLDHTGLATNVHPLNIKECNSLAKKLHATEGETDNFLNHKSLLPDNLLWYAPKLDGGAIWYTPKMKARLFFSPSLSIADGEAALPPLLWKASRTTLQIWALENENRPQAETPLYHAPFFNLYSDARVCMGNVSIQIPKDCSLTDFMHLWMKYFLASKFSHLLVDHSPAKMNIVQLWQSLSGTGKAFPMHRLKKTNQKLKNILP